MKKRLAEIVSQHKRIGRKELAESKGDEGDGDGVTDGDASSHVIYRKPEAQARDAAGSG